MAGPAISDLEKELSPPDKFLFPFEPYEIQKNFMRVLYNTLERGQVGIFESPTGTVKVVTRLGSSTLVLPY